MTSPSPSSMSAQEQIEYLAKFMGWHKATCKVDPEHCQLWNWVDDGFQETECPRWHCDRTSWNPRTDWNHWRQVEEKVMEDSRLLTYYLANLCPSINTTVQEQSELVVKADLPTRVSALIAAHQELYEEEPARGTDEGSCSKSQSCSCMSHD